VDTRAAVTRYLDALNGHAPDAIAACVAPDFVNEHTSVLGRSLQGRQAYRDALDVFLARFEGLHYQVEDVVIEEDRAALAYRMTARYEGRPVTIRGMFRFRVTRGLIAHRVDYWDSGEFTRQVTP
jgi:ketosteroid isomerase-like protein